MSDDNLPIEAREAPTPDWRPAAKQLVYNTPVVRPSTVAVTAPTQSADLAGLDTSADKARSDVGKFLSAVLPESTDGEFCIQLISRNAASAPAARWCKTPDDVARVALELDAAGAGDVYFTPGSFIKRRRKAENAVAKRALYLDLDCGDGKPYATKKAAADDLARFCEASGLPAPNVVVDSGNGVHAYWTFDRDVTLAEWQSLASNLKSSCQEHELHADPSVTADAARILRVPETHNRKDPTSPKLVKLLRCEPALSVEQLEAVLAPAPSSAALILAGSVDPNDLSGGLQRSTVLDGQPEDQQEAELRTMLRTLPDGDAEEEDGRERHIATLAQVASAKSLPIEKRVSAFIEEYLVRSPVRAAKWPAERVEREMVNLGDRSSINALAKRASEHGYVRSQPATPIQIGAATPALRFTYAKNGAIVASAENLVIGLSPAFLGQEIRFDTFRDEIVIQRLGSVNEWRAFEDEDYLRIRIDLERKGFSPLSRELLRDAVTLVAKNAQFDTAICWLESLEWDGVPRVERLLPNYFNTADTPYTRAVSLNLGTGMAGRVLEPGCKNDQVTALVGPQGCGKTRGVKAMVPDPNHYAEIDLMLRDADQSRKIRGKLIGEIEELRGYGRDQESVKAFITRTHEEWTPKYREFNTKFPRRLVLVATTNQEEFLFDETGHRRWLPVKVGRVDVAAIERDRLQLWAEARELFKAGGIAYADAERLARAEHGAYRADDVWEAPIAHWLDTPGPGGKKWGDQRFSISDLLFHAVGKPTGQQTRGDQMRAGRVLKHLGFESRNAKINSVVQRQWMRSSAGGVP